MIATTIATTIRPRMNAPNWAPVMIVLLFESSPSPYPLPLQGRGRSAAALPRAPVATTG